MYGRTTMGKFLVRRGVENWIELALMLGMKPFMVLVAVFGIIFSSLIDNRNNNNKTTIRIKFGSGLVGANPLHVGIRSASLVLVLNLQLQLGK